MGRGPRRPWHCARRPPLPQRPRDQPCPARAYLELWLCGLYRGFACASREARASDSRRRAVDVSQPPVRRRPFCDDAQRPGPDSAQLFRLRSGRSDYRPGAGDPGGQRQDLHRAQDRRGVQSGRRAHPHPLAHGRAQGPGGRAPGRGHGRGRGLRAGRCRAGGALHGRSRVREPQVHV